MRKPEHSLFFPLLWLCAGLLTACTPADPPRKPWREELTVIVAQAENGAGAELEQQLVALFAKQLQINIKLLPVAQSQVMPSLLANKAHIAAAGMRSNEIIGINFGPSYQTLRELVVCNGRRPRRLDELLSKDLAVVAGSSQESALREAQKRLPALHWSARNEQTAIELLAEVAADKLECTVANEEQLALARNFDAGLNAAFDIATPSRLAWAFAPDSDVELIAEAQQFFAAIKQDGTLRHLLDRYYGHNERLDPVDAVAFITKTRTVLPHFRSLFEEAATLTGIDWRLLAAIGYQESHWNPLATSRTNVRGMMMLTEDTADRMNVSNRLDARQSIMAGARYLQLLKEQLPLRIDEPDRTWLALAAYNQGYGHLEDARVLAERSKLNPDIWADVKKVMPLLAQEEYYLALKHGRARGGEAVIFVETVRLHHDILKHLNSDDVPRLRSRKFYLPFLGQG